MLIMTCLDCSGRLEFGPGKLLTCTECKAESDPLAVDSVAKHGVMLVTPGSIIVDTPRTRMATVIWIDGILTNKEPAWTHLIVWPQAGVFVSWLPGTTGEEAMKTWVHHRAEFGPLSYDRQLKRESTLIYIDTDVERADANEVYLIHWEEVGVVVPWPEGSTVKEAMDAWIAAIRY